CRCWLVGVAAYRHRRTQASTQGLASRLAGTARVLRDGAWTTLPSGALVPGDLVEVGPGEAVPADALVHAGQGLQVDESMLSGESQPASKRPLPAGATAAAAALWLPAAP